LETQLELKQLREAVEDIQRVMLEVADRGMAQDKVFDTLHSELQDYKNDFIYEHLKPVLWPLLFLFDSLEQYAREVVGRVNNTGTAQVEAKEVLDHLKFFRGQLVESLRICEVMPMKQPSGPIDPKLHKPIGTESVDDPSDENTVRRVVRTGWYLNGKVLRHAEVIVGKTGDAKSARSVAKDTVVTSRSGLAARLQQPPRASSDASASGGGSGS
jgi:molecular chaperone GrpE